MTSPVILSEEQIEDIVTRVITRMLDTTPPHPRKPRVIATAFDETAWDTFIASWWSTYRNVSVTVHDLYGLADPLIPSWKYTTERGRRTSLGMQLRSREGQQVSGYTIEYAGIAQHAARFRLCQTGASS